MATEATFDDTRVEREVSGDLSQEDPDILAARAKRSPVWSLLHFVHEMKLVVAVGRTPQAAD